MLDLWEKHKKVIWNHFFTDFPLEELGVQPSYDLNSGRAAELHLYCGDKRLFGTDGAFLGVVDARTLPDALLVRTRDQVECRARSTELMRALMEELPEGGVDEGTGLPKPLYVSHGVVSTPSVVDPDDDFTPKL